MDFTLSKEQELLRDGLTKFLATRYDLAKSRSAAHTGPGWQPDIWRSFADELGILGATFPEDIGGIGGGPTELMVITEASCENKGSNARHKATKENTDTSMARAKPSRLVSTKRPFKSSRCA